MVKENHIDELYKVILKLKNIKETRKFFRDLLTEREIIEFSQRWQVAKMLSNKTPYTIIEKKIGMSSTTIARVQKWLEKGMGGYKLMLKRI